jgi:hypothetical protein
VSTLRYQTERNSRGPVYPIDKQSTPIDVTTSGLTSSDGPVESPCLSCDRRDACDKPCEHLESLLAGPYTGKGRRETTIPFDLDCLTENSAQKVFLRDIYDANKEYLQYVSSRGRTVLLMSWSGLTVTQIAKKLKKSKSTISELLKRSRQKLEEEKSRLRGDHNDVLLERIRECLDEVHLGTSPTNTNTTKQSSHG